MGQNCSLGPVLFHAAGTAANDHFCDYATGPGLLAANHKNDTDGCERKREKRKEGRGGTVVVVVVKERE